MDRVDEAGNRAPDIFFSRRGRSLRSRWPRSKCEEERQKSWRHPYIIPCKDYRCHISSLGFQKSKRLAQCAAVAHIVFHAVHIQQFRLKSVGRIPAVVNIEDIAPTEV